jgi:manganese/zinc/iron transport system ATP- binding protein
MQTAGVIPESDRKRIAALGGPPPLEIHDMTVTYERKPVLWDVDLAVPENKLVGIVGPNGAGKSTLIKAVLGLVPRASGRVDIFGKPYEKQRQLVGYVPQRESVDWDFPISALEVVVMGRYGRIGWFRRAGKEDIELARDCLDKVGMAAFADRQISQLSGGQQQRVFLARALAQDASLYFMDEPFSGVDAATESAILKMLHELRDNAKTVVVVHHTLQTVKDYFDHVVMLNMHVVVDGSVDEVFTEENLQKTFGGRLSILDQATEAMRRAKK